MAHDLQFRDLQSFVLCNAMTPKGKRWLKRNVDGGSLGFVLIEFRYLEDIVLAARKAGLVCHG